MIRSGMLSLVGLGVATCFGSVALAADFQVTVKDFRFDPEVVYLREGDSVTWVGEQGQHNVNGDNDGLYGDLFSGQPSRRLNYTYTFTQADPEIIYSSDSEEGMKGALIVEPAFAMQPNMTGAWYEPATAGQGFVLEYMPATNNLIAAWFTYDQFDGSQQWFFGSGPMVGSTAELQMTRPAGGTFLVAEPVPEKAVWGTLKLRFKDCNTAYAEYSAASKTVSGTMALERISPAPGCVQPGELP